MAAPSALNPLGYMVQRQYRGDAAIRSRLFTERLANARNLYRKDLFAHFGCVNAIEFSGEGELLVSGGDDRRVLLWSVPEAIHDKGYPVAMQTSHISNIFCLAFDSRNSKIFSGGNDDQVIIHDIATANMVSKLPHKKPVYGLSVNPYNDDVLATAGDDGRVLLFDVRESPDVDAQCLAKEKTGFHSVMFNPTNPRFLVTANSEAGIALWDCRKPKEVLVHYDGSAGISACFDRTGKRLLALRRRLPPVLFATQSDCPVCQFYHPQYYNSCTMKTCCFAGEDDEYVLSGSDDFNLYMWKVPKEESEWGSFHLVLKGHRSIVNQVRYNRNVGLIASSGVEKMIKLWSSLAIGNWKGSLLKEHSEPARVVYTHEDYIHLVGHGAERISHDYSDQSTQEDAKMMAFFDSLIQREIEGWESPETDMSDTSSDNEAPGWSNLVSRIYNNSRNFEESKKFKANRIAQLIFKRRNRLAKMAHAKSSSSLSKVSKEKKKRKGNGKLKGKGSKGNGKIKKGNGRLKKYRTRLSLKDLDSGDFEGPSTSTGITNLTAVGVYRVVEEDSEEENVCEEGSVVGERNFINILPTPLNGTHDLFVNVLETDRGSVGEDDVTPSTSTANGFHGSSGRSNPDLTQSDSDSDFEDYQTPVKKKRTVSASDSGCATAPSSSSSSCCSKVHCDSNSKKEFSFERFKNRMKKARSVRKKITDSDSN